MPTVAFHTLGCKVNQSETAAMAHLFRQAGYSVVDFSDIADVYIVNTCAVTVQAERKSRQMMRRAREHNPQALTVMVGCYPQVAAKAQLTSLPDVDLIVGSNDKHRIVDLVADAKQAGQPVVAVSAWGEDAEFSHIAAGQDTQRTRATLKAQDGCRQFCAYCIIPYARGPERSRPPASVLEEARMRISEGFQEIVLTGIHLGSYGRDLQPQMDLADLVGQLLGLPGLGRLRLSSIEPNDITAKLLQLISQHKSFCRHLHIPLQAGDDQVLKAMQRRYSTDEYRQVVSLVRSFLPQAAITTDVIVGFPGESEEQFSNTCDFVQEIGFSRLHVFRYSRRPGTVAATLPNQIPAAEKERRSRTLIGIGEMLAANYAKRLLGKTVEVLWEHEQDGVWTGHTDTYVQVTARSKQQLQNRITPARALHVKGGGVVAELLQEDEQSARIG
ncbi:MAG: tRNA (N(6)-L-threonylcarbamoyladenosine(37)-C(2))-methylthiotransferase MtaB [Bacillota bacterium]|jgi:threonylcarbamoyladenosine tRNA methylthiotransferase MtaB